MSEVLNYYKISHYEPYDDSDDIIMGHKSRFTDSELSVMVYDVIDGMGGIIMIIECKKIAEGYKPVKGNEKEIFFINDETTFFKCGKNGEIHTAEDKYNFKNYFAVPFHKNSDLMRVFIAPNFESCTRDEVNLLVWGLKTTTETFAVSYNDILIFDMCWKIVDCLRNDQTQLYRDVLESNGYIIERD